MHVAWRGSSVFVFFKRRLTVRTEKKVNKVGMEPAGNTEQSAYELRTASSNGCILTETSHCQRTWLSVPASQWCGIAVCINSGENAWSYCRKEIKFLLLTSISKTKQWQDGAVWQWRNGSAGLSVQLDRQRLTGGSPHKPVAMGGEQVLLSMTRTLFTSAYAYD